MNGRDVRSLERVVAAARGLIPPAKDEDPRPWRINVFLSLLVIGLVLGFHIASSSGWLSGIGISAVANASELRAVDERTKAILKAIYSPQVRAKIRARCDTNDATEKERINTELDRLLNEYKAGAGEAYRPMPTCAEV